jgi:hypothetical protein
MEEMKMPLHFEDLDVIPEVAGLHSVLIVPCNICPAVTVAVRKNKPFLRLFRSFFKSVPFDKYIKALQSRLKENGVNSKVFKSILYHQWFMCMWPQAKRKKLKKIAEQFDAVIVFGCESATQTVRDAVDSSKCKVIEGMKVTGIMNAQLKIKLPADITFENCKIIPASPTEQEEEPST